MGCLSLHIQDCTIGDFTSTIDSLNEVLSVLKLDMNTTLNLYINKDEQPLQVSLQYSGGNLEAHSEMYNTGLQVYAGLICAIDLGYQFFDVEQGHLVVEEGYLKVERAKQ